MKYAGRFATPFGKALAVIDEAGALCEFALDGQAHETPEDALTWNNDAVADVARQIGEYCAGDRRVFELPLAPAGTVFQRAVWDQLLRIPYGRTISYATLAERLGQPGASRAVGQANGANPIALIIPCHRVIGADGTLTGYGGGLPLKRALLEFERRECGHVEPQLALGLDA